MNKIKNKRLGVIGGALDSAVGYTHYSASRIDGHWQFSSGVFSRDNKKNIQSMNFYCEHFAKNYKNPIQYIEDVKDEVDAFLILAPPDTHLNLIKACLANHKNVISEKPLVQDLSECLEIKESLNLSKGKLLVTYNYTGYPIVNIVRKLVTQGKIGKINSVRIEMPQDGFLRLGPKGELPKPQNWRTNDGHLPTIYLDLLTHMYHMCYFLTGNFLDEVIATENHFGLVSNVIDDVNIIGRSKDFYANFWLTKSYLGQRNGLSFRISGSEGTIEWTQTNPEDLIIFNKFGEKQILDRSSFSMLERREFNRFKAGHPAGFIEAFGNLYSIFSDAFENSDSSISEIYGIDTTIKLYKFMHAVKKSILEDKWITIQND